MPSQTAIYYRGKHYSNIPWPYGRGHNDQLFGPYVTTLLCIHVQSVIIPLREWSTKWVSRDCTCSHTFITGSRVMHTRVICVWSVRHLVVTLFVFPTWSRFACIWAGVADPPFMVLLAGGPSTYHASWPIATKEGKERALGFIHFKDKRVSLAATPCPPCPLPCLLAIWYLMEAVSLCFYGKGLLDYIKLNVLRIYWYLQIRLDILVVWE